MDKKIKAAAENDMHGYDEKAWPGMEQLLDKHLPQKRSRRRIAFFLVFGLLLIGIPTFFVLRNNSSDSSTLSSVVEQKTGDKSIPGNGSPNTQQKPASLFPATNSTTDQATTEQTTADSSTPGTNPADRSSTIDQSPDKSIKSTTVSTSLADNRKTGTNDNKASSRFTVRNSGIGASTRVTTGTTPPVTKTNAPVTQPTNKDQSKDIAYNETIDKTTVNQPPTSVVTAKDNKPVTTDATANETKAPVNAELTDSSAKETETPALKKEKKQATFASKFSITVSAGPDYSSVASRPGQWRGQYGFGVGYSINDKWSVRTGFYVARKVYTADTNSYKAPGNGPYNFKLDEIKANCLVYEVPVSVMYNFAKGKNHSWFVSGGLSSYFMRSEKYDYIYKYQTMTETHKYAFKNENTHLFSVLGLSAGYQYNFNRRLSLMAEPYVRLPLSGVGQGRVKLKSAGALFTLSYKPFAPR